jgi:hypothetical protein
VYKRQSINSVFPPAEIPNADVLYQVIPFMAFFILSALESPPKTDETETAINKQKTI